MILYIFTSPHISISISISIYIGLWELCLEIRIDTPPRPSPPNEPSHWSPIALLLGALLPRTFLLIFSALSALSTTPSPLDHSLPPSSVSVLL